MYMTTDGISPLIKEKAPLILAEIKKAKSILLHCHPSPDPDSVGSALAMKFTLEQLGKKATVIKGDSDIPQAFMHFPGAEDIVQKNFFEVDLAAFDLFISLDTASVDRISTLGSIKFPPSLKVINIDHHATNPGFGMIDLLEISYPATGQILFDLFSCWGIKITHEIAANLFIGIYTDTGGFKFRGATMRTFEAAAGLVRIIPDFPKIISDMERSRSPEHVAFLGLGLSSIESLLGGKFALASISLADLAENNIPVSEAHSSNISPFIMSVTDWEVGGCLCEIAPGIIKGSFRSANIEKYDVAKLTEALGGGGHRGAAGVTLKMSIEEAKKSVVAKAKELYNL
jgi:phosphoesterase RecJ-like protein